MAADNDAIAQIGNGGAPTALVKRDASVNAIRSEIDRARGDLADALGDLEAAAEKLTPSHWKAMAAKKAAEVFRRRPGRILAGAAVFGFWLGYRR